MYIETKQEGPYKFILVELKFFSEKVNYLYDKIYYSKCFKRDPDSVCVFNASLFLVMVPNRIIFLLIYNNATSQTVFLLVWLRMYVKRFKSNQAIDDK